MQRKPQGLADLQTQIDRRERGIEILTAAAEQLEALGPELAAFADETLPERIAALEEVTGALLQPGDPVNRLDVDLGTLTLAGPLAHHTHQRAIGEARRGVADALQLLRQRVQTLEGVARIVSADIAAEGVRFRKEFLPGARHQLAAVIEAKRRAARAVALELEAVQAEREALELERKEAAE